MMEAQDCRRNIRSARIMVQALTARYHSGSSNGGKTPFCERFAGRPFNSSQFTTGDGKLTRLRQRHGRAFRFLLVIFQRRDFHQGAFGVGAMNGLAVVPQSLLGESFRVAACLGAFRPCVAVTVQRNAGDAKLAATLPKLCRTVASPHAGQTRKQHAIGRRSPGPSVEISCLFNLLKCSSWCHKNLTVLFCAMC